VSGGAAILSWIGGAYFLLDKYARMRYTRLHNSDAPFGTEVQETADA
jgi:hypothetical protein